MINPKQMDATQQKLLADFPGLDFCEIDASAGMPISAVLDGSYTIAELLGVVSAMLSLEPCGRPYDAKPGEAIEPVPVQALIAFLADTQYAEIANSLALAQAEQENAITAARKECEIWKAEFKKQELRCSKG